MKRTTRKRNTNTFYTKDYTDLPIAIEDVTIEFPFKSRSKFESVKSNLKNKTFEHVPDLNPSKQLNKYKRPYFSPHFFSWEADLVFFTSKTNKPITYLFLINVNTKFLYVIYLSNKSETEMINAFMNLFRFKSNNVQSPNGIRINNLRFDGESALNSSIMKNFFAKYNIKTYSNPSPYINKNRVVDRVIRTVRTAFENINTKNLSLSKHRKTMQEIVSVYNNSIHYKTCLKPAEMTFDQEFKYIKSNEKLLLEQSKKQHQDGLFDYEPGDELLVYLPTGKVNAYSKQIFEKIRAEFVMYDHGNVVVKYNTKNIIVPIYYTKRLN